MKQLTLTYNIDIDEKDAKDYFEEYLYDSDNQHSTIEDCREIARHYFAWQVADDYIFDHLTKDSYEKAIDELTELFEKIYKEKNCEKKETQTGNNYEPFVCPYCGSDETEILGVSVTPSAKAKHGIAIFVDTKCRKCGQQYDEVYDAECVGHFPNGI